MLWVETKVLGLSDKRHETWNKIRKQETRIKKQDMKIMKLVKMVKAAIKL